MNKEITLGITTFNVTVICKCNNCGLDFSHTAEAYTIKDGVEVCINFFNQLKLVNTIYLPEEMKTKNFDICHNCNNRPFKNKKDE